MNKYINKIISLFSASQHSEELTTEVQQWLVSAEHADEKEQAIHQLWNDTNAKADNSTRQSLQTVYEKLGVSDNEQQAMQAKKTIRITWWHMAAAAVAATLVSIATTLYFVRNNEKEVALLEAYTPAGEMKTITLPDGSIVQTNSETLLLYPEEFRSDRRIVYLTGEANFKVAKDPEKPFTVKSSQVAVTALGTEFNVSAYPGNETITSTLIHGAIKVDCGSKDSYTLIPSQQVTYWRSTGASKLSDANINDATAWQRGITVFRGKTMAEIFDVLERRYNVSFRYNASSINNDKYNFSFRRESSLDEVMKVIKEVGQKLDYRIEEGVCYVKFK